MKITFSFRMSGRALDGPNSAPLRGMNAATRFLPWAGLAIAAGLCLARPASAVQPEIAYEEEIINQSAPAAAATLGREATAARLVQPMARPANWCGGSAANQAVNTLPSDAGFPTLVSDGAGGAIVIWEEALTGSTTGLDIFAHHVLASGDLDPAWPAGGVTLTSAPLNDRFPVAVPDGAGGAIVAWTHDYASSNDDIYAQHVRSDGTLDPAWPVDGLSVCSLPGRQRIPKIARDGSGGAFIAWDDLRLGSTIALRRSYVHHLTPAGVDAAWPVDGIPVSSLAASQGFPDVCPDGAGGVIVTWVDQRSGDRDVYAQRMTAAGAYLWAPTGVPVCTSGGSQIPNGSQFSGGSVWVTTSTAEQGNAVVPDGAGGCFISWVDERSGEQDVYAQHVSPTGAPVWIVDGVPVCEDWGNQSGAKILPDGAGGAFVSWYDQRPGAYAQHIVAGGWTSGPWGGFLLNSGLPTYFIVASVSDGAGGAIFTWQEDYGEPNWRDVYAHHMKTAGGIAFVDAAWPAGGAAVSTAPYDQYSSSASGIARDGSGGAIIAWADARDVFSEPSRGQDIYAQRILAPGNLPTDCSPPPPPPPVSAFDPSSEQFVSPGWQTVNFTPGWVPYTLSADHLVVSEIAPRGAGVGAASDSSEYLEIANPTSRRIQLDNYYITDDPIYWSIVNGPYFVLTPLDYNLRFPPGTALEPGGVLLVIKSELGFLTSFGGLAGWNAFLASNAPPGAAPQVFVMDNRESPPVVFPPMIDAAGSSLRNPTSVPLADGAGVLTNPSFSSGEWVMLYRWDGSSDLVCDVDYARWGAATGANAGSDKTGVMVDGPDADGNPSAYAPDVPIALRTNLGNGSLLTKPLTYQRADGEVGEVLTGGNGCVEQVSSNNPPVVVLPGPFSVSEGDLVTFTASASDPDGDAVTLSLIPPSPPDATINPGTGAVSWQSVDDAIVTFRVQADDGRGGIATGDVVVSVLNVAPVVTITGPPSGSVYAMGTAVSFTGTFSDPGTADTHTGVWAFDAMSTAATVDETGHTANASFTFTSPGVYSIRLTVTDDDGGSGTATTVEGFDAMIVVYDPNGGFVTGGGWYLSAPGAFTADPTLTGKATFGFVSKYQKGSSTPTGETEFVFHAGSLNFHSTSYEWLVIGGSKAQYKGAGTINGAGDFGFLLTAVDGALTGTGSPDKLRMKIWNRADNVVVYDNQLGAMDLASPVTAIGGGSIVIHAGDVSKGTSQQAASSPAPQAFALKLEGPSPFRGTTTVRFDLPERSRVMLAVFDVQGREVARLADGEFAPGSRGLDWNGVGGTGGRTASGLYFVRMTARSFETGREFRSVLRVTRIGS